MAYGSLAKRRPAHGRASQASYFDQLGVHPLIHPSLSIASGRAWGSAPTGSGGGGIQTLRGVPPSSCCRRSHHQCLPSPDGKQAIRKFLLHHRNQKPNTTQEGEKHHKPAISRADRAERLQAWGLVLPLSSPVRRQARRVHGHWTGEWECK